MAFLFTPIRTSGLEIRGHIYIPVPPEEFKIAKEAVKHWWAGSRSRRATRYRRGLREDAELVGALGQIAYGKLLGLEVDLRHKRHGDTYDFLVEGLRIDVKVRTENWGRGLVRVVNEEGNPVPITADAICFGYMHEYSQRARKATVAFAGYATRDFILSQPTVPARAENGRHMNKEVVFKDLLPMR